MSSVVLPRAVQDSLSELSDHYRIHEFVDRGENGYVFFARNKVSEQDVVIKFYAGEAGDGRHNEPKLLAQIQSPHVLRILEARAISDLWAFFITPRCERDLDDFIATRPSSHQAVDVALGICTGVSALHAQGLLHRDIKPGNVVMQGGIPLIADFGSVRQLTAGSEIVVAASRHTPLFRPPESFGTGAYSAKGDIYQIGVVTYQLLGGTLSYDGETYFTKADRREYSKLGDAYERSSFVDDVIRRRAEGGNLLDLGSLPPWINGATKRVIRRMTSPDPETRLATLGEVAADLISCRATLVNWQPLGLGAKLERADHSIEIRPTAIADQFEAFRVRQGVARRLPGIAAGTMSSLISRLA